ncbi:hypothetical protein BV25DRAFT_912006 [Artomyces pyxidatus]|uniref:Uncharacterized protein n=1 Tax=Artomyces pyxidatus TaxID=48021 RepID=A0ACB8SXB4_9AGAM|nr:hypothetical protein BV25DRAFT_912006 [Artomyces pyxidatus]
MKFVTALSAILLPIVANAQYGYAPPSPGPSSSAVAAAGPAVPSAPPSTSSQINVDVAPGGQLMFSPNNITAPNGTLVTFFFPAMNPTQHSVTQSSFADPCTYLAAANGSSGGFDSGLQNSVQFTINITDDTKPIWFHCKAPLHCGLGMVGSINAPATGTNTFSAFQAAAMAIGSNEKTEQDNGPVTGGVNALATATPAATASPSAGSGSSSGSSSGGVRVAVSGALGIVAAALAVVLA